jgi:hypothetical protein
MDKSTRDLIECFVLFGGMAALFVVARAAYLFAVRRGWVQPEDYRPSTTAMGNAMLSFESLFDPSKEKILEQRLNRRRKDAQAGDPPKPIA